MDIEFEAGVTKAEFVQAWDKDVDEDTRQEMYEAQKRGREKGAAMKGDAADIFHTAKEDGQDDEEALESVRDLLSEAHYNTYLASRLGGAISAVAAAFVRAFEKLSPNDKVLFDPFSPHVTDRLIPHLKKEERAKYDNLLKHYKLNELLFKMKSTHDGVDKGAAVGAVAAAFSRVFDEELPDDIKASFTAFSPEITSLILPHLDEVKKEQYNDLLKQYDKPEGLLSKMKSSHSGVQKSINTRKRKAEKASLDRGMFEYSDSDVPPDMNPIKVKCKSCDGVEMTTHVNFDKGSGSKTFEPGIWKHVLPMCGKSGKSTCRKAHLEPVDEGHSFNSYYPQKADCIKYDTVRGRFKPRNLKKAKTKKKK